MTQPTTVPDPGRARDRLSAAGQPASERGAQRMLQQALRQPVAAIEAVAAAAASMDDVTPPLRRRLDVILNEARRAARLCSELAPPPSPNLTRVDAVVTRDTAAARAAYQRTIGLAAVPALAEIDESLLSLAFWSLLDVAFDRSAEDGQVRVAVLRDAHGARIEVSTSSVAATLATPSGDAGLRLAAAVAGAASGSLSVSAADGGGSALSLSLPPPIVDLREVTRPSTRRPAMAAMHELSPPASILVCDDEYLVADALRTVLERRGYHLVVVAATIAVAASVIADEPIEVCVLGVPGGDEGRVRLDALADLLAVAPATRLVVLFAAFDHELFQRAVAVGASGVAVKNDRLDHLIGVVESVHAGTGVPDVRRALARGAVAASARSNGVWHPAAFLTEREREVLERLVRGETTGRVAASMGIRYSTARTHIQNVLTKLGVHSQLEAVALAVRDSIVAVGGAGLRSTPAAVAPLEGVDR